MFEYFSALGITIAVEYIVYLIFIRKKPYCLLLYSIIINCITHPLAYYFYSYFLSNTLSINSLEINNSVNIYFIIIELVVFLSEVIPIKYLINVSYKKAFLISFTANLVTASLSFIV
ncbi:MAG: hypothetical protein IT280_10825 [Ignavibacteria bacterium]|nr:hypothetical protein [Ignavibacteria bacterium]